MDMVVLLLYMLFTNDRQKSTKVKCKRGRERDESTTKQSIFMEFIFL